MTVRADTMITQRLVWECPECGHNNVAITDADTDWCFQCQKAVVLDVYPKADCTGEPPKKKDILERLRNTPSDSELCSEAADDIERLREQLHRWFAKQ